MQQAALFFRMFYPHGFAFPFSAFFFSAFPHNVTLSVFVLHVQIAFLLYSAFLCCICFAFIAHYLILVERAWVRAGREAVGPEGQVVPQQWPAQTTAPAPYIHRTVDAPTVWRDRSWWGVLLRCGFGVSSPTRRMRPGLWTAAALQGHVGASKKRLRCDHHRMACKQAIDPIVPQRVFGTHFFGKSSR